MAYHVTGDEGNPPIVLLHALGESSVDWEEITPALARNFLVFAPDLRGHADSAWPGEYSTTLMCDDVAGWLDQLGLDPITLVGHSMGALVAFRLAVRRPGRISRLIIEDASPPYKRDVEIPERPDDFDANFDWAVVPSMRLESSADDPQLWDGLAGITAPTLIIGGGQESNISQAKLAEVAARIPHCDLVTIPSGHHVHRAKPSEFTDAVINWLGVTGL